ncbi:actin, clone 302-like [Lytechinus variegatus]|uniref:actin, clone 302-like n=1 Tax=Lytechinus variegatus TaxID=7654 RepID=UPI001BB0F636|nr:actin, clone 302-like [Lytechinus variegatus]
MGKSSSKHAVGKSSKKKHASENKVSAQKSPEDHSPTANTSAEPPQAETPQTNHGASQAEGVLDETRAAGTDVHRGNVEPQKTLEDLEPAVVIDIGSYSCKYGLAGESYPAGDVRTIVGRHQQNEDSYVGIDALNKRSVLDISYPVERGLVKNWDDLETVWEFIFERKLRVDPNTRPVVLTEPAKNPKANREKMIEIMFEKFDVPAFYLGQQSMSALFVSGIMTGVVIDVGDGVTDIVPINNGVVIDGSVRRLELAGRDITEYMMKSPAVRGEKITYEIAETMKTSTCEVVADFDEVTRLQREGQDVHHLYATEALFQPSIFGRNHPGIHAATIDSIMASGEGTRDNVGANVVLVGGSTLFRGFHDRLERELMELAPPTMPLKLLDRQDRETIVWSGASLFASHPVFKQHAISSQEYLEVGPEIVNRQR